MFRIAPVVLLASLSAVGTAQADQAAKKDPIKQAPANATVNNNEKPAEGTVIEPGLNGDTVISESVDVPISSASLKMNLNGSMVEAYVYSSQPGFLGVVGLSLTKDLTYAYGLPPLLAGGVVMAFGATDSNELGLRAPLAYLPAETITLFGQALVIDELGFWSSNLVSLTIGGKNAVDEPANGSPVNADKASAAH